MRKEIIFAIILGLVVGLLITYGVYRSRQVDTSDEQDLTLNSTPTTITTEVGNLVLHSPADESVVDTPDVTVAGTTDPQAFVVIFVNDIEHVTNADLSGNFSLGVTLETGSNVISVHALNEDGKKTTQERVVIHTTQTFDDTGTASSSAQTSEDNDE